MFISHFFCVITVLVHYVSVWTQVIAAWYTLGAAFVYQNFLWYLCMSHNYTDDYKQLLDQGSQINLILQMNQLCIAIVAFKIIWKENCS